MITYGSTTLTSYNTITKIEVYYYKSTSATSLSGGSWSTTKPTWENGKYIWQKIRTTYEGKLENGQFYSESDPVNITGQQGATGTAAYSYKLNASDTSITVSKDGTYSKTSITFSATSKQGTGAVNAYAGRFKIETTANGTTWTTQYTSNANESSKEYTIPTGILNIRCSLYQAGGTSVLLDIVSVAIVADGIDGTDGTNGTSQNLLLDVYASSMTKVKAPWDRYLSDTSNTTITGEFIAENNLPDPNATHFYRITDSSTSTKSRGFAFYNDGSPPLLNGHTYRIGCWVRNHAGSPSISFYLGSVGSWTNRKIITNTNWEWIECVHTFGDTDPAINAQSSTYKRIYFYFGNNNVEGSSLDMCGFKVEEVQTNISTARNYLLKTENLDGWGVTGGTTISNGIATFPEVIANTWREFYPTKNFKYEIIRNKNIIFSVRVKADVGKICACNLCIGVDSTETAYTRQKYTNNFVYFTGTGEWQTICVAIPISDEIFTSGSGTPNYDNCWVTVRIGAVSSYHNSFQATQPQLSLGTTATAWSIAPEDVEVSMQEKVDNIEIGGRNLLLGSAQKIPVHWSTSAQNGGIFNVDTNVEVSEWRTKDAYRIYGQAGSTSRLFGLLYGIPFTSQLSIQNQSYTFSIFVKNQANVDFLIGTNSLGDYISIAPGESKRVVATVIGNGSSNIQFTFSAATNGDSYDAILWHPKIEFGNKVTDWSPAPEDNLKGTNIEPFFSHDITDIYDSETNPNGYWMNNGTSYGWTKNPNFTFTQLEDGWLHVHIDNSSGTGTIRNDCCVNRYNPFIKRATKYTFLAEFRNNQSTGAASGSDFYLVQQSGSVQFWGQNITTAPLVHLDGIGTATIPIFDIPSDGRYTFSRFTKFSEPEGSSSHWTTDDMMSAFTFRANAGAVLDYDVRLSLYEGEYWGQYNPYVISDITNIRQSTEEAHNKIDNLEIGGRNLLYNSATMPAVSNGDKGWRASGGTATHIDLTDPPIYDITGAIRVTNTSSSIRNIGIAQDKIKNKFIAGEKYTQSCWVRASETLQIYLSPIWATNDKSTGSSISSLGYFSIGTEWTYIKWEGAVLQGEQTASYSAGYIYAYQAPVNSWFEVCGMKLEKGAKATDWTPAPEDTQADIDTALAQSVEYIIGTQTAATGTWTGRASTLSELRDGTQIRYWLPYAGSGNATLNLTLKDGTATGAIPVYRQGGSYDSKNGVVVANRVTTHFPAGTSISMVYGVNRIVSAVYSETTYTGTFTGWFADGAYDSGNTINRTRLQNVITAETAITAAHIICGTATGYKNIGAGINFDLSYPILYASSAIAATKTGDNNFLQINGINASNNGTIQSGATKKVLYLKGTVSGNIFTISASPFMTTVTPTSTDSFYYIPLGMMYSTTNIYFISSNRLYAYLDGAFQPVDTAAILRAEEAKKTAINYMSSDDTGIMVADLADGEQLPANATGKNVFITAGYDDGSSAVNAGVHIRNGQEDLASFGEVTVIGKVDEPHLQIESTGIYGQNNNNSNDRFFEISQNSGTETVNRYSGYTGIFQKNATTTKACTFNYYQNNEDYIKADIEIIIMRTSSAGSRIHSTTINISTSQTNTYTWTPNSNYNIKIVIDQIDASNEVMYGTIISEQNDIDISLRYNIRAYYSKTFHTPSYTLGTRVENSENGTYSFVEGIANIASGYCSHAGGERCTAEGRYSYAKGAYSEAKGNFSVAIGDHTIANGENQTVIGRYNKEDEDSLFIIGNGADLTLFQEYTNALTVDQTGNIYIALDTAITSSGTTDNDLYSAITTLGWETDIITSQ